LYVREKLSRRTFLTAGSALVVLHSPVVRALESSGSVNIQDYNPQDWVASFRQAFKEGQMVVVPKGLECKDLNTAIVIPPGKILQGRISGNGRGRFILQDGCAWASRAGA
jgi:colanic acid biosynthesis protein WcaM